MWLWNQETGIFFRHPDALPELLMYRRYKLFVWPRLRDRFKNYVEEWSTYDYNNMVVTLTGNNMPAMTLCRQAHPSGYKEPVWTTCTADTSANRATDYGTNDAHAWSRLVFRTGYNVNIRIGGESRNYALTVSRLWDDYEDDRDAGNGPHVPERTSWYNWFDWGTPEDQKTWVVGRRYIFRIQLNQNQGLRFNDYIPNSRIEVTNDMPHPSDQIVISRWYWGIYMCTVYTEKSYDHENKKRTWKLRILNDVPKSRILAASDPGYEVPTKYTIRQIPEVPYFGNITTDFLNTTNCSNCVIAGDVDTFGNFTFDLFDYFGNPSGRIALQFLDLGFRFKEYGVWQINAPSRDQYSVISYNRFKAYVKLVRSTNYAVESRFFINQKARTNGFESYQLWMHPGQRLFRYSWAIIDYKKIPLVGLVASETVDFYVEMRDQYENIIPSLRHFYDSYTLTLTVLQPISPSPEVKDIQSPTLFVGNQLRTRQETGNDQRYKYVVPLTRAGGNVFKPILMGVAVPCDLCQVPIRYYLAEWARTDIYQIKNGGEDFVASTNVLKIYNLVEFPVFYIRMKDQFDNVLPTVEAGWMNFTCTIYAPDGYTKLAVLEAGPYKQGVKFQLPDSYYVEKDKEGKPSADNARYRDIPNGKYTFQFRAVKNETKPFVMNRTYEIIGGGASDAEYALGPMDADLTTIEPNVLTVVAGEYSPVIKLTARTQVTTVVNGVTKPGVIKFRYRDIDNNGIKLVPIVPENYTNSTFFSNAAKRGYFDLQVMKYWKGTFEFKVLVNKRWDFLNESALDTDYIELKQRLVLTIIPAKVNFLVMDRAFIEDTLKDVLESEVDNGAYAQFTAYDQYINSIENNKVDDFKVSVTGTGKFSPSKIGRAHV